MYSDRVVWNIGYFSLSICRCLVFLQKSNVEDGEVAANPPAFEATERVVGGLPKQNGLMSPADASLGKMKRSCGKKNDTSPVLTTLGVLC